MVGSVQKSFTDVLPTWKKGRSIVKPHMTIKYIGTRMNDASGFSMKRVMQTVAGLLAYSSMTPSRASESRSSVGQMLH